MNTLVGKIKLGMILIVIVPGLLLVAMTGGPWLVRRINGYSFLRGETKYEFQVTRTPVGHKIAVEWHVGMLGDDADVAAEHTTWNAFFTPVAGTYLQLHAAQSHDDRLSCFISRQTSAGTYEIVVQKTRFLAGIVSCEATAV